MCMTNYKFLTIILLTTWIIFMTGTSYAQISEQIPSPKKQLDNGVAPHDVVCRDDLILVDRGMNNIACVKKTTAQKMNWGIINNTLVEKSNIVKNNETDVVFETITSTYNSNGHGIGSSHLPSMTSFTFPRNVTVGETFFINYTIDWLNENGTLFNPTLYSNDSNIGFTPFILATNEFSVLNNSFNFLHVMADKNASHMLAFYNGDSISFSNETITDSIEIQLTENMMYTLDTMYIFAGRLLQLQLIDNNNSIGLIPRSELGEDNFYSYLEIIDANRYRILISFDNDTQKWYKDDNIELDTLPNGFPNYIPETTNLPTASNSSNTVTNSIGSQEQLYIPQVHWEKFSEYLRSVEKYENVQITREWLMGENLSEDFVNDFFVAYPEFLMHDTIFNDFFLPQVSATAPSQYFIYGNYEDLDYNVLTPGKDVRICAYDVDEYNISNKQVLTSGTSDVCTQTTNDGYFALYGINEDPDSNSAYIDLQLGVTYINDDVQATIHDSTPVTVYDLADNIMYNTEIKIINVDNVGPYGDGLFYYMFNVVNNAHDVLYSKTSYDAPFVTVRYIAVGSYPFSEFEYLHTPDHSIKI